MNFTIDDLNPYGQKRLEEDYQNANRRKRCSREDFTAGWIACAEHFRILTLFVDGMPKTEPKSEG